MAGGMYAPRDIRIGLNNQLVFLRAQRSDGFLPGQVSAGPLGAASMAGSASGTIQGLFLASAATDVSWYMEQAGAGNRAAVFRDELAKALEAYDGWLWSTRNTTAMCRPASIGCVPGAGNRPRNRPQAHETACCKGDRASAPQRG
jgi:hypothetical protein